MGNGLQARNQMPERGLNVAAEILSRETLRRIERHCLIKPGTPSRGLVAASASRILLTLSRDPPNGGSSDALKEMCP
jgi:hypothetical protein